MSSMAAPRTHPAPAYASPSSRAHPYAAGPSRREQHREQRPRERRRSPEQAPPSPPRSRRDETNSPHMSQQQPTVDPSDNYWDDLPAPPASLKSVLDSFRRAGEGDRELLMAILQAKRSEEERLTAVIQTRLTVLQARMNLFAMQAQMPAPLDSAAYAPRAERTPSLSSSSTASASSPPANMPTPPSYMYPGYPDRERVHLPPPMGYHDDPRDLRRPRSPKDTRGYQDLDRRPSVGHPQGLNMLLEGVREAERSELV